MYSIELFKTSNPAWMSEGMRRGGLCLWYLSVCVCVSQQVHREPSPPIPTLQRRQGTPPRYTPRPPTFDSQRSTAAMSVCV